MKAATIPAGRPSCTPAGDIELSGASEADHDFIAHARRDQETLLAEIRRRRDEERDVSAHAEIVDSKEYGVVWTSKDADLADRFEDFLTERCFVLLNIRFGQSEVSLLFGQASSVEKVRELYERFLREA